MQQFAKIYQAWESARRSESVRSSSFLQLLQDNQIRSERELFGTLRDLFGDENSVQHFNHVGGLKKTSRIIAR